MSKLPETLPCPQSSQADTVWCYAVIIRMEKAIQSSIDRLTPSIERLDSPLTRFPETTVREVICPNSEKASLHSEFEKATKNMVSCRTLGYLLHYGPNDTTIRSVVDEVFLFFTSEELQSSAQTFNMPGKMDRLLGLGEFYACNFLLFFRKDEEKRIASSWSSFDEGEEEDEEEEEEEGEEEEEEEGDRLEVPPSSSIRAKKTGRPLLVSKIHSHLSPLQALLRDGFRCMVSGCYDWESLERDPQLVQKANEEDKPGVPTVCCHIFPPSTDADNDGKRTEAAIAWTILARFGYSSIADELNAENVHRLDNVLTLSLHYHTMFKTLRVWLDAIDGQPNTYRVTSTLGLHLSDLQNEVVTFVTPDPVKLPPPSPAYLKIHAACARIAHLSGASEYHSNVLRRVWNVFGSSAEALSPSAKASLAV